MAFARGLLHNVLQRDRRTLLVLLVVIGAYFVLRWIAVRSVAPAIVLPEPGIRQPFAVEFTLPDLTGRLVRLTDLRGHPVLINLWATWCHPCREEMPSLHALYTAYREQGFLVVAVATDTGGRDTVAPFIQQYGLTFPVLLDPRNTLGERLQVAGIPTSYVLDRQGRIVSVEVGKRQWNRQEFRRLLERLLAESAGSG